MHREVNYEAPAYLGGKFELMVMSKDDKALPLGNMIAGEADLPGNNEYIRVDQSSCFLLVPDEGKNIGYDLHQGVDVSKDEKLAITCKAKNNYKTAKQVMPNFTTYYRDLFGENISAQTQDPISFEPNEEKNVYLEIPIAEKPQAYDAVLTFWENQSSAISNSVSFHYIIQGETATIQNIRFDKDFYLKGETAKASFFWTSSADNFEGSRSGGTKFEKSIISISVWGDNGRRCTEAFQKEVSSNDFQTELDFDMPVENDCFNPKIEVKIMGKSGRSLDESSFQIESKSTEARTAKSEKINGLLKVVIVSLVTILFILSLILILIKHRKKNKSSNIPTALFILFLLSASMLFGVDLAKADTFRVHPAIHSVDNDPSGYTDAVYTASISSTKLNSGDTLTAYGGYTQRSSCANGYAIAVEEVSFNNTYDTLIDAPCIPKEECKYVGENWICYNVLDCSAGDSGSREVPGPVQSAPGQYVAKFTGQASNGGSNPNTYGTHTISYTVAGSTPPVDPPIDPPASSCGGYNFVSGGKDLGSVAPNTTFLIHCDWGSRIGSWAYVRVNGGSPIRCTWTEQWSGNSAIFSCNAGSARGSDKIAAYCSPPYYDNSSCERKVAENGSGPPQVPDPSALAEIYFPRKDFAKNFTLQRGDRIFKAKIMQENGSSVDGYQEISHNWYKKVEKPGGRQRYELLCSIICTYDYEYTQGKPGRACYYAPTFNTGPHGEVVSCSQDPDEINGSVLTLSPAMKLGEDSVFYNGDTYSMNESGFKERKYRVVDNATLNVIYNSSCPDKTGGYKIDKPQEILRYRNYTRQYNLDVKVTLTPVVDESKCRLKSIMSDDGACFGTPSACALTMGGDKTVTVTFESPSGSCTHDSSSCDDKKGDYCLNDTFPDNCGNYVCTGTKDCTGWRESGS